LRNFWTIAALLGSQFCMASCVHWFTPLLSLCPFVTYPCPFVTYPWSALWDGRFRGKSPDITFLLRLGRIVSAISTRIIPFSSLSFLSSWSFINCWLASGFTIVWPDRFWAFSTPLRSSTNMSPFYCVSTAQPVWAAASDQHIPDRYQT